MMCSYGEINIVTADFTCLAIIRINFDILHMSIASSWKIRLLVKVNNRPGNGNKSC